MKSFNLLAIFCLFISSIAFANTSLPNNRHISVTGTAKLTVKPDIAIVHLQVESLQTLSLQAKADVDRRVNLLLAGLERFNIDETNVSASSIATEPRYSYSAKNKQAIDGYVAKRSLKVTLSNLEQLNDFMDFALSVKINKIRQIELKSSKSLTLIDEVNALAVKNAKEKARSLAQAFDAKLGNIYSINQNAHNFQGRYGANQSLERFEKSKLSDMSEPGRYLQENIVYSASISVVFDLTLY